MPTQRILRRFRIPDDIPIDERLAWGIVAFARVPGAGAAFVQRRSMYPEFIEISVEIANRAMLNRAMQLSGNLADAEDLVQDIWLGVQSRNDRCLYLEHLLAAVARQGIARRAPRLCG